MPVRRIKYLLSSIGAVLIYLLLVWMNNQTVLVAEFSAKDSKPLQPQVYYTAKGHPFSETKSVRASKYENGRYFFSLPSRTAIDTIRLDPDIHTGRKIVLGHLFLIDSHWFHTRYYALPTDSLKAQYQIHNFIRTGQKITFQTVGKDPQLLLSFIPKHLNTQTDYHPVLMMTALILWLFLLWLWHLYRHAEHTQILYAKLILYGVFFSFIVFKTLYYKDHIRFSYPPDELAHLSYIAYIDKHHDILPHYEAMTMINNPHNGNYLSHPPLYYALMDTVYDTTHSIRGNVSRFRSLSMMLYLLGVMLIFYIAFSASLSITGDFVFLSLIASVPMHAYIGASISNDTLAILSGAIFAVGLLRMLQEEEYTSTYLLIALGGFLAYFSKLTAALLVFFALIGFLLYRMLSRKIPHPTRSQWMILLFTLIPVMIYQGYIMLHYHGLIPTFNLTHPHQYLTSPFFVPEQYRLHLNLTEWFHRLMHYIQGGWFGIHSHHSFGHPDWWGVLGLVILHIMAISALFVPCPAQKKAYCLLGKITLAALFAVLVIQFFFSYKAHIQNGYLGGLQPRYLLPFMFGFGIMASIFAERFKQYFAWNVMLIVLCIQALYSDFFYFLQYYR